MPRSSAGARLRAGVPALAPLAALYGAGVAVARAAGLRRRGPPPAGVRVVALGNLEVGGSGKTPLAIHLLEGARSAGAPVAYVSRGYGSPAARARHVALLLPDGGALADGLQGVRVLARNAPAALAEAIGDEAALVAARVPGAIVAVCAAKERALDVAVRAGAGLVVVDDAFQSWGLARTRDVVLLDAAQPLGPGRMLPAGTLRESPAALGRADVVVFNGAGDLAAVAEARARVAPWLRTGVAVAGLRRELSLDAAGAVGAPAPAHPARALVVCGIARPERFAADLAARGVATAGVLAFPDHHRYTAADAARIARAARALGADALVVTEKDWVKLGRFAWEVPVVVAVLQVALVGDAALVG